MKYWLVTEDNNYADEFALEAFALHEAENEEELKEMLWYNITLNHDLDDDEEIDLEWPREFYFGSNESVTYNSKEDLFADLGVSEITEQQYNITKELLGTRFGVGALL